MTKRKATAKKAKKRAPAKSAAPLRQTTADRYARFVAEYLIDRNATQAAVRAGYSKKTAYAQGHRLLSYPSVQEMLAQYTAKMEERLALTSERIAEHFARIITADPNELIEYRRECCRYCWGEGFLYQRTPLEMRLHRAEYDRKVLDSGKDLDSQPEFDPEGGIGYNRTRAPNAECPECFGEGVERPYPKDTRKLGPEAAALYAGVKVTKDGLEIKMHSKEKALELYGRHLGMFVEKHEFAGPGGKELPAPQFIINPVAPAPPREE